MSMFGGNAVPSLSDIAAVTGNRNGDGNGWGADGGWWVLIILFALFGGWGNGNGYGNGGGGRDCCCQSAYDTQAVVQRGFDNQAVINKLNGIENGICSLGYDQLAQMNGISNTITQTGIGLQNGINQLGIANMQQGFGITQAINADTVANMQNTNALSTQLANCCCENRANIADLKYTMATDACALNTNIHQTGDAIINSQNAGFQMLNNTINNRFTQLEMSQKDQQIADLQMQLNRCDRDSALQSQATYLLGQLNPQPRPAYFVQNPNCCGPMPVTIQSNGCGCGGNNFNGCCA